MSPAGTSVSASCGRWHGSAPALATTVHSSAGPRAAAPVAVPAAVRLQQRDRGQAEGLPHPLQQRRQRRLAPQHAAGEGAQGLGLRGRAGRLPGTPRGQVDHGADQRRDHDEDHQGQGVVGLADGEACAAAGRSSSSAAATRRRRPAWPARSPPTRATTTTTSRNSSTSLTRLRCCRAGDQQPASAAAGSSTARAIALQPPAAGEAAVQPRAGRGPCPSGAWVTRWTSMSPESRIGVGADARAGEQRGQPRAPAAAEHELGGVLRAGELEQGLRHVVADDLVVGAAERLDQLPLGGEVGRAGAGEPVGAGDVDGEQVAAGGAGGDPRGAADQRLALGPAGEGDDDALAGLPGPVDVVLLAVAAAAPRRPCRRSRAARARAAR